MGSDEMGMISKITEWTCDRKKKDPLQMAPLALAYIGDTVYDLFVRTMLVEKTSLHPSELHRRSSDYVCAAGQKDAYFKIRSVLTEEEEAVFKKGRNAHSGTIPKNAAVSDYRTATGLETLFGYLFLSEREDRLCELISLCLEKEEHHE